jgi:hypothetical protein
MPEVDLIKMSWGGDDFVAVEYTDTNLRLRRVHVNIQAPNMKVRAIVWDTDQGGIPGDPETALVDVEWLSPTIDEYVLPGNYRAQEYTDEIGSFYDLPENLRVQFFASSV